MKKVFLVLLCVFLLTGCNYKKETKKETERINVKTEKNEVIGNFITKILDTDPDRVNNLQLCARTLDGVTVEPGQIFSFNDTVGKRTSQKGYEEAKILVEDKCEYAVGGGVCQISSTLYNAAKDAGMEIVERHSHSKDVHYVEKGNDAAVSWGSLDFKFRNVLTNPITLKIKVENGQVMAQIIK